MSAVGGDLALSQLLRKLADDTTPERVAMGDLLALGDRAIGALLVIFAFPNILPVPPGTSAVLGAPLVFLVAQLASGMRPWLPGLISRRSMSRSDFDGMIRRVVPWLERAEKLLRPRVSVLALPPCEFIVGVVCLLLATVLVLLVRDGYAIATGLTAATISAVVVSGAICGFIKGVIFMIAEVVV